MLQGRKDATEWTLERIREAFEKVAKDEIGCLSIVQGIMLKSTDFLRSIIAPVAGQGGVTLSYVCPHCNCFPLEDYIWWVSTGHGDSNNKKKKSCSWWCVVCDGQDTGCTDWYRCQSSKGFQSARGAARSV